MGAIRLGPGSSMEQVERFRPGQPTGSLGRVGKPGGSTRRMIILQNSGDPRRGEGSSAAGCQFEGEYQMGDV